MWQKLSNLREQLTGAEAKEKSTKIKWRPIEKRKMKIKTSGAPVICYQTAASLPLEKSRDWVGGWVDGYPLSDWIGIQKSPSGTIGCGQCDWCVCSQLVQLRQRWGQTNKQQEAWRKRFSCVYHPRISPRKEARFFMDVVAKVNLFLTVLLTIWFSKISPLYLNR